MQLNEIAKMLGVSKSAVSRVLNNNGYVAKPKWQLIEAALRENGYQVATRRDAIPHSACKCILLITETLDNMAYIDYISGIDEVLSEHGYNSLISISNGQKERELQYIKYSTSFGIGGIIMLSAVESPELLDTISKLTCPIVLLNRRLPSADVDTVLMDNFMVGRMATNHLIENGHKKIIHFAGLKTSTTAIDRCRGYLSAMKMAELQPSVFWNMNSYESAFRCAINLKTPFTAVFSLNTAIALACIDGLYEKGLRCPDDFSIVCTDNTRATIRGKIAISAIGYDSKKMGCSAAELLFKRIDNPDGNKHTISYLPTLTSRESVRNLRTHDS